MKSESIKIVLVGNGSYQNRGCEAIVRGTMEILRNQYGENVQLASGAIAHPAVVDAQVVTEQDEMVRSFSMSEGGHRWSPKWWASKSNDYLGTQFRPYLWQLNSEMSDCAAVLQVGGDNYTLDYGLPTRFLEIDQHIWKDGIPLILWGASVGPFSENPDFEKKMFEHLSRLDAVFVRECLSFKYLVDRGLDSNVYHVADPAFLLPSEKPKKKIDGTEEDGIIGINLSPLIGKFRTGKTDVEVGSWMQLCVDAVASAAEEFQRPILLIPHVLSLIHI